MNNRLAGSPVAVAVKPAKALRQCLLRHGGDFAAKRIEAQGAAGGADRSKHLILQRSAIWSRRRRSKSLPSGCMADSE